MGVEEKMASSTKPFSIVDLKNHSHVVECPSYLPVILLRPNNILIEGHGMFSAASQVSVYEMFQPQTICPHPQLRPPFSGGDKKVAFTNDCGHRIQHTYHFRERRCSVWGSPRSG